MTINLLAILIMRDFGLSVHRPSNTDDVTCRIKVEVSTFDGAFDPKVFGDWLMDMAYYFDWYNICPRSA